jgi:hypothetical protein
LLAARWTREFECSLKGTPLTGNQRPCCANQFPLSARTSPA